MWVDKKTLKQYIPLQKEIKLLEQKIDRLRERALDVPTILGKVTGSSHDFPYTEVRMTVQMDEPKESDEIGRLMRIKEARLDRAKKDALEIEEFIAAIPDSTDRQIFEMSFLDGKKQREVAEIIGYTQARISQKINGVLQD